MNIESILKQYDFNLAYAKALVEDIPDELMTTVPGPGLENHPAFTLGHLVSGSALLAEDLGAAFEMQEEWRTLFLRKGPGDPRLPDPDGRRYPEKSSLLSELQKYHERVSILLLSKTGEELASPFLWRFDSYFPSLYDLVIFMCISHEAMHLGQLAAWRRAMGFPSALKSL
jgi:hypothetical protein